MQWFAPTVYHHNLKGLMYVRIVYVSTGLYVRISWKPIVIMMPTLLSLLAPQVVITTTCGVASDEKVVIVTNRGSPCNNKSYWWSSISCIFDIYRPWHIEAETKWPPFCTHFQTHFLWMNFRILISISLKFVLKGAIDNKSALVPIMAWRLFGAKPLSDPMLA